ncbi:hypothetical protein Ancab_000904 [Ancistrocladus abbreviatus]
MFAQKERSAKKRNVYSEEFQAMLDRLEEEDYAESERNEQLSWRKRRLTVEQVKALEKNFEAESKLEPERKMKIANELGLDPRQVAVWFQNRRARWKAKQLETQYGHLEAEYEALKQDYDSVEQERKALLAQLEDLKAKVEGKAAAASVVSSASSSLKRSDSSSSVLMEEFQLCKRYESQSLGMEEQGLFSSEGSCHFFSVDQPPTLHWHFADQGN